MIQKNSSLFHLFLHLLVFFCGFANLATEIIGPRLFASLFGNTTEIWAIIISVTLVGMSAGYWVGGRIPLKRIPLLLPGFLLTDAIWLTLVGWIIWKIPAATLDVTYTTIFLAAFAAFFTPALLFSTVSPMVIALLNATQKNVGNIYALGTIGSVMGALTAAFYLIPWVGLARSLQVFALILVGMAGVMIPLRRASAALAAPLAFVLLFPQPAYTWELDPQDLLAQKEGYYQTIRVYSDRQTYVRMHLGPSFQSQVSLPDKEPAFGYARRMFELAGDVQGLPVLVIGGAGHAQARWLEQHGATVTEVEIDPRVVELSDQYFGPIQGRVVVQDGRAFVQSTGETYARIFLDAFDGAASVPPQLTTLEFFQAVRRVLTPGGRLLVNFIGAPEGQHAGAYRAFATTLAAAFPYTGVSEAHGQHLTNVLFVAATAPLDDLPLLPAPAGGSVLTDDLNPIEVYLQQAREGLFYMR